MAYSVRIDDELKNKAFPIIEKYGLTPSQLIKLVFRQIAETKVLPLSFDYQANVPNEETKQAIRELINNRQTRTLKEYDNWNDLIKDIQGE